MITQTESPQRNRRQLLLRDSLTFLALTAVTVVLFALTLLLFRSFEQHRADLAQRWSDRGRASLGAGRPEDAIRYLRAALQYAPGKRSDELLLAEALAAAGRTEEANTYFTGLWDAQPGSGPINLQLARLAARRNDQSAAVNFYNAAIFGTWQGDGVVRRREVRLELARYLLALHKFAAAREDLLITGGNFENTPAQSVELARLLEQAGAPVEALRLDQEALRRDSGNLAALEDAGSLAYNAGDFPGAHRYASEAERVAHRSGVPVPPATAELLTNTDRLLALSPFLKLTPAERTARVLRARDLARQRWSECVAAPPNSAESASPDVRDLDARWKAEAAADRHRHRLVDAPREDSLLDLVFQTETTADRLCGPAKGDDALLLHLLTCPTLPLDPWPGCRQGKLQPVNATDPY